MISRKDRLLWRISVLLFTRYPANPRIKGSISAVIYGFRQANSLILRGKQCVGYPQSVF